MTPWAQGTIMFKNLLPIAALLYKPGVARLFFSRAKFEDSLFDEGLKI